MQETEKSPNKVWLYQRHYINTPNYMIYIFRYYLLINNVKAKNNQLQSLRENCTWTGLKRNTENIKNILNTFERIKRYNWAGHSGIGKEQGQFLNG